MFECEHIIFCFENKQNKTKKVEPKRKLCGRANDARICTFDNCHPSNWITAGIRQKRRGLTEIDTS